MAPNTCLECKSVLNDEDAACQNCGLARNAVSNQVRVHPIEQTPSSVASARSTVPVTGIGTGAATLPCPQIPLDSDRILQEEWQRIANFHLLSRGAKYRAIITAFFGLLAIWNGYSHREVSPINVYLIWIGAFLLAESVWTYMAPSASTMLAEALGLFLVGGWNCWIAYEAKVAQPTEPGIQLWGILGLWQLMAGFKCLAAYPRYSQLPATVPSAEALQQIDRIADGLLATRGTGDGSIVEFKVIGFWAEQGWKGQLSEHGVVFLVRGGWFDELIFASLDEIAFSPRPLGRARLRIRNRTFNCKVERECVAKFKRWNIESSEVPTWAYRIGHWLRGPVSSSFGGLSIKVTESGRAEFVACGEWPDSFPAWRTVIAALVLIANTLFVPGVSLALAAEITKQMRAAEILAIAPVADIQSRYFAVGIALLALAASLAQFVAGWGLLLRQVWAIRVAAISCLLTVTVVGVSVAEYLLLSETLATLILPGIPGLIWSVVLVALLQGKWAAVRRYPMSQP